MKLLVASIAALSVATVAAPAFAGKRTADMSVDQLQAKRVQKLMRYDTNGDQRLSRAEFDALASHRASRGARGNKPDRAMRANRPGRDLFSKTDINRDGFITVAEIQQKIAKRFARRARTSAGGYTPNQGGQPAEYQDDRGMPGERG